MGNVFFLSLHPRRLRRFVGIGTTIDNPGNRFTEFFLDIAQSLFTAAIFHRVMKQRGDRFCFIGAIFHRNRAHAENVRDEWDAGLLPSLIAMNPGRVNQRLFELPR